MALVITLTALFAIIWVAGIIWSNYAYNHNKDENVFIIINIMRFGGFIGMLFCFMWVVELHARPIKQRQMVNCPLNGEHTLRKMSTSSGISGYFILGSGSIQTEMIARFAWNNNGIYQISEIDVKKMRIIIANIDTPFVIFDVEWPCDDGIESFNGITVYCRERDFPQDLNINL